MTLGEAQEVAKLLQGRLDLEIIAELEDRLRALARKLICTYCQKPYPPEVRDATAANIRAILND